MDENEVSARWLLNAGALPGVRLFRNTVGSGWMGKVAQRDRGTVVLRPGSVVIHNARFTTFGLCPDSSDFIGWDHGHFLAVEMKTLKGKARLGQENFLHQVATAGGTARIVRDPDDYLWLKRG